MTRHAVGGEGASVERKDKPYWTGYKLEPVNCDAGRPDCVVILVHGTYARKETWTMQGPVVNGIKSEFGNAQIYRYEWSGDNSHTARLDAETALRTLIKEQLLTDPVLKGLKLYVVAHSHGGNVVLYSMKDSVTNKAIDGVVCLATPFLVLIPSRIERSGWFRFITWFGVPILGLLALALIGIAFDARPMLTAGITIGVIAVVALAKWLAARHGDRFPLAQMFSNRNGPTEAEEKRLKHPKLDPKRLLVLSVVADEAGGGLNVAVMLAWFGRKLVGVINKVAGWFYAAFIAAACTGALVEWVFGEERAKSLSDIISGGVGLIVLIIAGAAMIITAGLIYLPNGAFGWDAMSWSRERQTAAEESPPGLSHIIQLQFDRSKDDDKKQQKGLHHSELCWRPESVKEITDFIKKRRSHS